LWRVRVVDGGAAGAAEIVRRNISINHGFIRDGSLLYGIRSRGRDVLTSRLSEPGHLDAPTLLSETFVGSNGGASWSPNGQEVGWIRGSDAANVRLVIRSLVTGEERIVPTPFEGGLMVQAQGIRWLPDGVTALMRDRVNSRPAFITLNVESGAKQVVFSTTNALLNVFEVSPDGRFLVYVQRGEELAGGGRPYRVIRRSLESGEEVELYSSSRAADLPAVRGLAVSPDGKHVATRDEVAGRLLLLPLAGGAATELHKGCHLGAPGVDARWTIRHWRGF
jgi:hypothetical protein